MPFFYGKYDNPEMFYMLAKSILESVDYPQSSENIDMMVHDFESPNFQHLLCNLAFKIKEASGMKIPDSVFFFKEGFEMDAGIVKMRDMFKAIGYMDCACCLLKAEWEEGLSREEIIRRVATDEGRYFLLLPLAQRYQTVLKEEKRKEQEGNMKRCVQYTLRIILFLSIVTLQCQCSVNAYVKLFLV